MFLVCGGGFRKCGGSGRSCLRIFGWTYGQSNVRDDRYRKNGTCRGCRSVLR
ncbi:UNVERIFIED_CONTAM: hypothetical protein GTU68_033061 [Idotea baltica]|nr:hypothetical protein [Idotea baltica]